MKRIIVTASLIEEIMKEKERKKSLLESQLSPLEIEGARKDHHSRREPIACGMTIHTGIGCNYGCIYCYVPEMGFPLQPKPYPLNGLQLVYALLLNPFFVPGPYGTMLAFGSVTEPFMRETIGKTLEYLQETHRWLSNPTQISTKSYIDLDLASTIHRTTDPHISFLVTITTIRYSKILEPNAPPPNLRFETMRNLSRHGIHVTLFLRPIIPGVTNIDLEDILSRAAASGARGVVPGTLRITPGIIRRLRAAGIDVKPILARAPRMPKNSRDQVPIRISDLKEEVRRLAAKYGLKVFPSSCSANMDSHSTACWACKWGPCGSPSELPVVREEDVTEIVELLIGEKAYLVRLTGNTIVVFLGSKPKKRLRDKVFVHWLSTLTKRRVIVQRGKRSR